MAESNLSDRPHGKLIIISGPSGAGKTTILHRLDACFPQPPGPLVYSVSATTRAPRRGEKDGVDYHFLSSADFEARRTSGDFLECFEVYQGGDWYGTLRSEVSPSLAAGKWVVLEIDVQGTLAVLEQYPDAVTIFVEPGSLDELEKRLRDRGTEAEASIQRRLAGARRELNFADRYAYRVTNDNVDAAVQRICDILLPSGG